MRFQRHNLFLFVFAVHTSLVAQALDVGVGEVQISPDSASVHGRFLTAAEQVLGGAARLNALPRPRVVFFGGHHYDQKSDIARQAYALAQMLVEHDASVITGGGPGIMEAANCGAWDASYDSLRTLGIKAKIAGQDVNRCVKDADADVIMDDLFARKFLLMNYANAFVVFPGGIGTLDELSEVLVLMAIGKVKPVPIVLMGKEFWEPIVHWLYEHAPYSKEFLDDLVSAWMIVVDDNEAALEFLESKMRV